MDDEAVIRRSVRRLLETNGFEVIDFSDGADAVACIEDLQRCCIVLLDQNMPRLSGVKTYRKIREVDRALPICFISGFSVEDCLKDVLETDPACAAMDKPFAMESLNDIIGRLCLRS